MKKLILLLSLPLWFMACSSSDNPDPDPKPEPGIPESEWLGDWNDPENPNYETYKGSYNPLRDVSWELTEVNGKATDEYLIYEFYINRNNPKNNEIRYCNIKPKEGKDPSVFVGISGLEMNDKQLKIKGVIYEYNVKGIVEDKILTLSDRKTTRKFKVYQKLAWSWLGDWNDPKDPHYEKYKGQYNPIKGVWKITYNNGIEYYKFSSDFRFTTKFGDEQSWKGGIKYVINNKGYGITYNGSKNMTHSRYTLSDDKKTLTIQEIQTGNIEHHIYTLIYVREE